MLESEVSFLQETVREKEYEVEHHLRKICHLQDIIDSRTKYRVDASSMTELQNYDEAVSYTFINESK